MNLSTPQYVLPDYVCPFAVRVPHGLSLADFLGSMITHAIALPRGERHTFGVRLGRWICLPPSTSTPFNGEFRISAVVSRLRLRVAPCGSKGMLTLSAIGLAVRLSLRTRLTPG